MSLIHLCLYRYRSPINTSTQFVCVTILTMNIHTSQIDFTAACIYISRRHQEESILKREHIPICSDVMAPFVSNLAFFHISQKCLRNHHTQSPWQPLIKVHWLHQSLSHGRVWLMMMSLLQKATLLTGSHIHIGSVFRPLQFSQTFIHILVM